MIDLLRDYMKRREEHGLSFKIGENGVENISVIASPTLGTAFKTRADALFQSVERRDVDAILTLFKGKWLYEEVVKIVARPPYKMTLPPATQRYRDIRKMTDFAAMLEQVQWMVDLRTRLLERLAR